MLAPPCRASVLLAILLAVMAGSCVPGKAFAQTANTPVPWQQDKFVIGTWMDPTIDRSRPVITQQALATARAGHFNLLTGMHHHFSGWRVTTPPDTGALAPAAAAGLSVALTHNDFYGTAATPWANVPAYDSTLAPYVFNPPRAAALSAAAKDALEGWCLWDEPPYDTTGAARVSEFLKNWTAASHLEDIRRADGRARFTWLNLLNGCGTAYSCYETYLRKYLSDPDPLRRPDVASITLFPFTGPTAAPVLHNYFYWLRVLREVCVDRPFWVISMASEVAAGTGFSRPDDNQFRFMAFAPVAAGARGVVWFTYNFDDGYGYPQTGHWNDSEAIVREDFLPTCKYEMLQPINRYLETVIGPVVMSSRHLGLFHQSTQPPYGDPYRPEDFVTSTLPAVTAVCPVSSFDSGAGLDGSGMAVAVYKPLDGSAATYLLVLNKALTTRSSIVRLRAGYEVAASPGVVGYEGGMNWSPLATGNSFPVTLRGGEARLYRLTTSHVPSLALDYPAGGEMWAPGEKRVIRWRSDGLPVDVRLYACASDTGSQVTGPLVFERRQRFGDSDTLTMPSLVSRHVRIEIVCRGADGVTRRATHGLQIRTALPPAARGSAWTISNANCHVEADLVLNAYGSPVVAFRDDIGRRLLATMSGGAWQVANVNDPQWPTANMSGTNPRLALDETGRPHLVFTRPYVNDLVENWQDDAGLWHWWALDQPHRIREDAPIVSAPDGSLLAAFDGGTAGLVIKRGAGGTWAPYGPAIAAVSPRSISLVIDDAGKPWVAFVDRAPGDAREGIRVLEWTGAAWKERAFEGRFDHVALCARPGGRPAIVYTERMAADSHLLWHRDVQDVSWPLATLIEPYRLTVKAISLAWFNGGPRLAYVGDGVLKYASLLGGQWSVNALEEANEASGPVRLAIGPAGEQWVLYHDVTLDALRVLGPGPATAGVGCARCPTAAPSAITALRIPNPLRRGEALAFDLSIGAPARFDVALFDVAGRRVAARDFGTLGGGEHHTEWRPQSLPAGAYFLRCRLGDGVSATRRLVLLR